MAASMSKPLIFLSSVQKELAAERQAVKEFVENDPLLRRFFTVFLFETLPASGRRADEVYLEEVDHCALYVGLFGNSYGFEDSEGISPTEREFDRATATGKERLIFVLGSDDTARHPKMQQLVRKAGDIVSVRERSKNMALVLEALQSGERDTPDYVEVDAKAMTAKFIRAPEFSEVPYPVKMEPSLVIEFYAS